MDTFRTLTLALICLIEATAGTARAAPAEMTPLLPLGAVSAMLFGSHGCQRRALPEIREGRLVGMRFFLVRPGSLFARVGLREGDVIRSAHGVSPFEPEGLAKVLEAVKRSGRLVLEGTRQGRPLRLDIPVVMD